MKLHNGVEIPPIGFGTYNLQVDRIKGGMDLAVETAILCGYRLFDTAHNYGSEETLGAALQHVVDSGLVLREDIFIQTKFHPETPYGYQTVMRQFEESINKLRVDYLDAYMIHVPVPRYSEEKYRERNIDVWKAFEELYYKGKIRAIGVSNFLERHILQLSENCREIPMFNQIEVHPFYQERGLAKWCQTHGTAVQGWSPLARGDVFKNDILKAIAQKHGKTIPQVCLRWALQRDIIPIVAAADPNFIKENADVFNFTLDLTDMEEISALNTNTEHWDIWMYKRQQMY
ncbi:aldo/keto reductase [Acutalibacter intestini]|uniref:aldo/keto reductase n=1 Tax=Acutalibacter intestini TaxID=3093659 RepID=UPI002AC8BDDF|nr:aldo/keto reductase [Acutalibacter sp. M00204]